VYEVLLERGAEKDLNRLAPNVFQRVVEAVRGLKNSSRPKGSKKLAGSPGGWRIRVGDYRIIYDIDDRAKRVRIFRIRHRREVYR
jgi:mRNA interferase RelE/StbE